MDRVNLKGEDTTLTQVQLRLRSYLSLSHSWVWEGEEGKINGTQQEKDVARSP